MNVVKVADVRITPVAVSDPPLLNSVGVHQPFVLRAVLEIETDEGLVGLGETYGHEVMLDNLYRARAAVVGSDPFDLNGLACRLRGVARSGGTVMPLAPGTIHERADASLFAAFEVAFLDLQGKILGRPVADLLGGAVRERVPFAAYLFYKYGEHVGFDVAEPDDWGEALTPEAVVRQAERMVSANGFESLKLKGGVMEPRVEIETVRALRTTFPDLPLRIDPNTAWTVETSIKVSQELADDLEYFEDPVAGIDGMAKVAAATDLLLATNMAVVGFGQLPDAIAADAVQIVLADHHYWGGLQRSRELARICETWGLGLSMHSNSHLGISFAAMTHLAASLPGLNHACDTHQPWQTDEVIAGGKLPIEGGSVAVPQGPGLGVELDHDQLYRLHEQYQRCGIRERDDKDAMRRRVPDWTGTLPRF